jgi:capsular exopolysaccharide synthesis family protein
LERKELFHQLPQPPETSDGFSVDIKRVLYRAVRYWYLIVLSIITALVIAFLVNRYSVRVYPVTASLIVKEAEDISGAELLYNNPLLNFKRNYLNEVYIIKSYPLVERVIEDLNFDVAFYREGNVLTTEAYGDLPIEAKAVRAEAKVGTTFTFTTINEETFRLQLNDEDSQLPSAEFNFNDTISYASFKGVFILKHPPEISTILNQPLIFTYTPSSILADKYVNELNVDWAEEGAGVVNLLINGSNPQKQKDFLSGLILEYKKNDLENKNETASRTVKFISEQLDGISDSLRQVERQLQRFKDKNIVTDLTGEALRLYEKVEALEGEMAQIRISKNYYQYLIEYIERNEDLHQIILPSSIGINDPILSGLVSKMNEMQLDIKMSSKEDNPLVREGVRRINEMKSDIIESVRNQESTDNIKLQFLSKQVRDIEKQLDRLPLAERTLVSIQRNYALQENLYIFLLQKKSEAAISQASATSDIITVNPPKFGAAISPKTTRNYLIGVSLGLCLPLLFFVLLEVVDTRVQSKEDIEKLTMIPFIGGVGHKSENSNLAVFDKPKSVLAESFRALRSNLNYFIGQKDKGVFLVTSSISGEGKTFTSINLAAVLSLSGKKTLIVGADMRKPKIFGDFDLANNVGLSTYLATLSDFDGVVQNTSYKNLDFVSGGPVPPNPSELLLSQRMASFIAESTSKYEFIIIDTPPLGVVTDAFVLSPYADHILFLVRQNYTPKELLKTAEDFYAAGKIKNISIVLNDIHRSGPGYGYGYAYSYGYGYGNYYGTKKSNGFGYYTE